MAKTMKTAITLEQYDVYKIFHPLATHHGYFKVWSDFIILTAYSLCLSNRDKRNEEYKSIASRYKVEELKQMAEMASLTMAALTENPEQDFLGNLFIALDLNNIRIGQVFTPYHIGRSMSALIIREKLMEPNSQPWISVCDPACGAGALLIAFANECSSQKINYQTDVLFAAQDIDRLAAMMCFIQLSLLGCAGYVVVGNALTHPLTGPVSFLRAEKDGLEVWYTPMFFTSIWQSRLGFEQVKFMEKCDDYATS